MKVSELFWQLRDKPSGHTFTVVAVSKDEGIYVGADRLGRPCMFVRASERFTEPTLRTAYVSLQPCQEYRLSLADGSHRQDLFHALCCEASTRSDIETFLVLIEAFLAHHEVHPPTAEALSSFFRSMVRLFAVSPARDLKGERQGLWGELFTMKCIRGFPFWAPFWHSEVTRLFDFSAPGRRVEVKTVVGGLRVHHFSHRQIYALEGEEIGIASLLLREEEAGVSLQELITECRIALQNSPFFLKVERAVRHAGMEDTSETGPVFDAAEAERALAWFRSTDAPHFRMPEPPGVSETHYKVDLSGAPRLDPHEVEVWLDTWPVPSAELTGVAREYQP